jgi:hypothetical protein
MRFPIFLHDDAISPIRIKGGLIHAKTVFLVRASEARREKSTPDALFRAAEEFDRVPFLRANLKEREKGFFGSLSTGEHILKGILQYLQSFNRVFAVD